uniref:Uncharacterized protein n=1 Tax=Physcomitrium patens TaxID=3218 RepID=A0A2K1ICY3_PHYPA|nr:hypothetical protein PHYPA_030612 [Physcomitrium patens]
MARQNIGEVPIEGNKGNKAVRGRGEQHTINK